MNTIALTPLDLALAALLVVALAITSSRLGLRMARPLLVAALRTTLQLLLVGLVLRALFANATLGWVALLSGVMLVAAAREVRARQQRHLLGAWGWAVGGVSMGVSSFAVMVLALIVIIGAEPWYAPRYSIPLLGMLLGNTMTGIALAVDRLSQAAWERRALIEQRLLLGQDRAEATLDLRRDSLRAGLIPIVNAMAAAGLVSLPGMMTGQILAGSSPLEAVNYQILILFLIAGGTGFGTLVAVGIASRRLFDERHRLRLDRLAAARS